MNIVLVHGSYHGSWCWDLVRPELERRGHRTFAVDLPVSDPTAGAAVYAQSVLDILPNDAVLLGHSMAGLVIPLVAAQRRVRLLVFLAAFLPSPGLSMNAQRATASIDSPHPTTTAEWMDLGDDVWMVGPTTANEIFFHDLDPERAVWAYERLRPQAYRVMSEPTPLDAWPEVASRYVLCRDDRALNPAWARDAVPTRLRTTPVEIDGGHSPFLSRPDELASLLDRLLREDPRGA